MRCGHFHNTTIGRRILVRRRIWCARNHVGEWTPLDVLLAIATRYAPSHSLTFSLVSQSSDEPTQIWYMRIFLSSVALWNSRIQGGNSQWYGREKGGSGAWGNRNDEHTYIRIERFVIPTIIRISSSIQKWVELLKYKVIFTNKQSKAAHDIHNSVYDIMSCHITPARVRMSRHCWFESAGRP